MVVALLGAGAAHRGSGRRACAAWAGAAALAALLAPGVVGAGGSNAAPAFAAAAMAWAGGSSARDTRDVLHVVGGGSTRLSDVRWSHATNSVAKLAEV